jgi:hypothetical protein
MNAAAIAVLTFVHVLPKACLCIPEKAPPVEELRQVPDIRIL